MTPITHDELLTIDGGICFAFSPALQLVEYFSGVCVGIHIN